LNSNPNIYKYIALAALGVYIYKVAQNNGGTLKGNPQGIGPLNTDRVVDTVMPWVNVHPVLKEVLRKGAKSFINGLNGNNLTTR